MTGPILGASERISSPRRFTIETIRRSAAPETQDCRRTVIVESIGRYKIVRELGQGATAMVYLAEDPKDGRPVAVKLVRFNAGEGWRWSNRVRRLFRMEGNMARILDHPNIIRVYEHAVEEDYAYIVMEYMPGRPLSEFVTFDKLLPPHRVVGIVFQCCLALDYAFKQGIIHRDIKPANIMVDEQDNVKITDFGLALNLGRQRHDDSTFIMGVGSPAYMSPEQIKGHPLNQKTDLYSLGVVLYEMLTGRQPFRAANKAQLIYKIINAEPPPVSTLNPDVPPGMDQVLQRALEKDLYTRYRNGAEMAQDLAAVRYQILDDDYQPVDTGRFDALRRLAFFREFDDIEIWEVLRISTWLEYEADTVLMQEGDEEKSFGVVVDGEVEVSVSGKRVARVGRGEPVGEAAYLSQSVYFRTATVTTLTPVIYLEVNPSALALATEECLGHFRDALVTTVVHRLALVTEALAASGKPAHKGTKLTRKLDLELVDEAQKRG